jgi:hypothetical protein
LASASSVLKICTQPKNSSNAMTIDDRQRRVGVRRDEDHVMAYKVCSSAVGNDGHHAVPLPKGR